MTTEDAPNTQNIKADNIARDGTNILIYLKK